MISNTGKQKSNFFSISNILILKQPLGYNVLQIFGISYMRTYSMKKTATVLHSDQTGCERKIGSIPPQPWPKFLVTWMLMRDIFAVA